MECGLRVHAGRYVEQSEFADDHGEQVGTAEHGNEHDSKQLLADTEAAGAAFHLVVIRILFSHVPHISALLAHPNSNSAAAATAVVIIAAAAAAVAAAVAIKKNWWLQPLFVMLVPDAIGTSC
jgi:hypothetical protein